MELGAIRNRNLGHAPRLWLVVCWLVAENWETTRAFCRDYRPGWSRYVAAITCCKYRPGCSRLVAISIRVVVWGVDTVHALDSNAEPQWVFVWFVWGVVTGHASELTRGVSVYSLLSAGSCTRSGCCTTVSWWWAPAVLASPPRLAGAAALLFIYLFTTKFYVILELITSFQKDRIWWVKKCS